VKSVFVNFSDDELPEEKSSNSAEEISVVVKRKAVKEKNASIMAWQ
jgi:hypothetical protein